ncbi:hypothetical protein SAMN04490202_4875 [Pseudomonas reinekei]|uniref:Uncharacterized protein n=1 Tax=Pseudomonas reinekei TaxID=395598 RepID=A0A1H0TQL8_PSERE|nr:hypothetical protein SAMN04490202_4875 [Pseudomonas reinekei]
MLWVGCVHIRFCGNGCLGFRSYSGSLWKSPKVTKGPLPLSFGASPGLGMPALRSCSVGPPPSAIHGRGRLTRHPCRVAHCAAPALGLTRGQVNQKPNQMRGGLTADLAVVATPDFRGSWPASDDGLTGDLDVAVVPDSCGSWPASDGGLTVSLAFAGVHIRFCGNGCLGFRSYSGSLWKSPKVTKGLLPLSFGASPRLGMPALRSCSVGPPPSAIHGRGRLTRHPCRVAHCAAPALGLTRGQVNQKPNQMRGGLTADLAVVATPDFCGSWPASDGGLTGDLDVAVVPDSCGSWPASDGGLTGDLDVAVVPDSCGSWPASDGGLTGDLDVAVVPDSCGSWPASDGGLTVSLAFAGVHIRCCGNGCLGFRSYSGSLWKSPKVIKGLLPLSFGASLWLGMPSLRSCSVGPPPSAIHGRGRLTRHPCRVAHCAAPALGLSMGQENQKPKPKRGGLPAGLFVGFVRIRTCRSRLAGDGAVTATGSDRCIPPPAFPSKHGFSLALKATSRSNRSGLCHQQFTPSVTQPLDNTAHRRHHPATSSGAARQRP